MNPIVTKPEKEGISGRCPQITSLDRQTMEKARTQVSVPHRMRPYDHWGVPVKGQMSHQCHGKNDESLDIDCGHRKARPGSINYHIDSSFARTHLRCDRSIPCLSYCRRRGPGYCF